MEEEVTLTMSTATALQQDLPIMDTTRNGFLHTHFDEIYESVKWKRFDDLESRFHLIDGVDAYKSLVNTSLSKYHPYHSWFRYREGYAGDLVKDLISRSKIDPKQDFVADPMCGSGSTLVAAKEVGVDCLGLDVNPYAVEISNAKVFNPKRSSILSAQRFINELRESGRRLEIDPAWEICSPYFESSSLSSLADIYRQVMRVQDHQSRQILRVVWLSILEECSNRKKDGNGLVGRPTQIKDVFSFFREKGKGIISDFINHPLPKGSSCLAVDNSALEFSLAAENFSSQNRKRLGSVIFSPPYANSFDYFESYKIELLIGGYFDVKAYRSRRKSLIRSYRITDGPVEKSNNPFVEFLCEEVLNAIPEKERLTGVRDGRTRLVPYMLRGYFNDMEIVLKQLYRALRSKGNAYIVVDQSSYVGIIIPTDILIAQLGEDAGFRVTQIIKCRKANTSGQQLKRFPYLKHALRESIVCLEK